MPKISFLVSDRLKAEMKKQAVDDGVILSHVLQAFAAWWAPGVAGVVEREAWCPECGQLMIPVYSARHGGGQVCVACGRGFLEGRQGDGREA